MYWCMYAPKMNVWHYQCCVEASFELTSSSPGANQSWPHSGGHIWFTHCVQTPSRNKQGVHICAYNVDTYCYCYWCSYCFPIFRLKYGLKSISRSKRNHCLRSPRRWQIAWNNVSWLLVTRNIAWNSVSWLLVTVEVMVSFKTQSICCDVDTLFAFTE